MSRKNLLPMLHTAAGFSFAALVGCSTSVSPEVTGGSKSDGVVTMAFDLGGVWRPDIDDAAALSKAREACARWGFANASKLGEPQRSCAMKQSDPNLENPGCVRVRYELTYQCHD